MKILICSHHPPVKELGAPKVLVELAEALRSIGETCTIIGPAELEAHPAQSMATAREYNQKLRTYLREHAAGFDVVDYDHEHLPFPRGDFDRHPLFVARSVLLAQFLETIKIPRPVTIRSVAGAVIHGSRRAAELRQRVADATATVEQADLVNVCNQDDRKELVRRGIPTEKIVVIPFGISATRRPLFDAISSDPPVASKVAFVGTFDYRKGARDFPAFVAAVCGAVPDVQFKLLGTGGMFRTTEAVLQHFPARYRDRIEVLPKFPSDELPRLLADCSVGIFPSYYEGFPFGVLEMLAASLPVIAYDAPGAPMMLPPTQLVKPGDAAGLAAKVIGLLRSPEGLRAARQSARQASQAFSWPRIAQTTVEVYGNRRQLQSPPTPR